ncbi:acyl-CoA N-acyltransferase [Hypoxylon rubiginosum]|uniref:Acyl-CoA N-acyltransferase n=1 Tax=Hypoxylon rubiginosum TaxID=110542 RepID=A0ACC0CSN3_9PEZI|nr:acyl-CoA N-acyltransferase [Hypoxylon rubiginosum]
MENQGVSEGVTLPCIPLPSNSERKPIRTQRLVIRPLREDDLPAFHVLRSQAAAMTGTSQGRPDRNIDESRTALCDFLPPCDRTKFLLGVFLASTGEFMGEGGVHTMSSSVCGWPEIGYKFKEEFWGQGYATEFLAAMLEAWWKLPRSNTGLRFLSSSIPEGSEASEQISAVTEVHDTKSQRVLEKVGFVEFIEWTEPDTQEHRLGQPVTLVGYRLAAPK